MPESVGLPQQAFFSFTGLLACVRACLVECTERKSEKGGCTYLFASDILVAIPPQGHIFQPWGPSSSGFFPLVLICSSTSILCYPLLFLFALSCIAFFIACSFVFLQALWQSIGDREILITNCSFSFVVETIRDAIYHDFSCWW